MQLTRKSARTLAAAVLAALVLAAPAPASAQTGVDLNPPPSPSAPASPAELISKFLGTAIPNTNFIATASRMASAYAGNSKLRALAVDLAKTQTSIANSLAAWVNVSGPVVTRQSPAAGLGGAGSAKIKAPGLLPAQVSNLQRLSTLRGSSFDSLYVSTLMETLVQLQMLYRDTALTDVDPGLYAIATRELPKVEETISKLSAL
ncbi:MAG: DUF4142 domain-containing protein [Beijerinckiaceae bacterium]|nr:DUF4142 domain-containing protein [Beijerinckiaceae bacterium]MCI0735034.1 DUF4142 domain-containing protein [Beijerinckiaceae bacterium]